MTSTGAELTFWDHVTLLGALGVVIGYIIFRIRIALNPSQGGCGGCGCSGDDSSCSPASPAVNSSCSPPSGINLLEK